MCLRFSEASKARRSSITERVNFRGRQCDGSRVKSSVDFKFLLQKQISNNYADKNARQNLLLPLSGFATTYLAAKILQRKRFAANALALFRSEQDAKVEHSRKGVYIDVNDPREAQTDKELRSLSKVRLF